MPVAQIVAGFTKVFVGEIVEKGDSPPPLAIVWVIVSLCGFYSAGGPSSSWRERAVVS
jgi:hypothetical protein